MAGMGKRMRPHTLTTPKPLFSIAGKPIVQRLVEDIAGVVDEQIEEIAFIIGRFGKDVDTPYDEFLNDDGLSHIVEGGLSLHISYEKTDTNQCRLRAHIE